MEGKQFARKETPCFSRDQSEYSSSLSLSFLSLNLITALFFVRLFFAVSPLLHIFCDSIRRECKKLVTKDFLPKIPAKNL